MISLKIASHVKAALALYSGFSMKNSPLILKLSSR